MIIAFYPGAGGNRYLRMMQNLDWQKSNITYDDTIADQNFLNRYLLTDKVYRDSEYILTHCLNFSHIKNRFPDHDITFIVGDLKQCLQREWILAGHDRYVEKNNNKGSKDRLDHYNAFKDDSWPICSSIEDLEKLPQTIVKEINEDFKKIYKEDDIGPVRTLEEKFNSKINSAYDIITWHKDYYSKFTLDFGNSSTVIDLRINNDDFSISMRQELNLYQSEVFNEVWSLIEQS